MQNRHLQFASSTVELLWKERFLQRAKWIRLDRSDHSKGAFWPKGQEEGIGLLHSSKTKREFFRNRGVVEGLLHLGWEVAGWTKMEENGGRGTVSNGCVLNDETKGMSRLRDGLGNFGKSRVNIGTVSKIW